jgi:hypothetical protein
MTWQAKSGCAEHHRAVIERTETGFGSQVQVPLRMLWILIGEGMKERFNVLNLDGNAAGQASYRPAELPFPLIGCGSGDWGAKVGTKCCRRGWKI